MSSEFITPSENHFDSTCMYIIKCSLFCDIPHTICQLQHTLACISRDRQFPVCSVTSYRTNRYAFSIYKASYKIWEFQFLKDIWKLYSFSQKWKTECQWICLGLCSKVHHPDHGAVASSNSIMAYVSTGCICSWLSSITKLNPLYFRGIFPSMYTYTQL